MLTNVLNVVRSGLSAVWSFVSRPFAAPEPPPAPEAPIIIPGPRPIEGVSSRSNEPVAYLSEIEWITGTDDEPYFARRANDMVFDTRGPVRAGRAGVTAGQFVLCEGSTAPVGSIPLGEAWHTLTPGQRASLAEIVGEPVPALSVAEVVHRLAVNWTDVTGRTRCRPVRVGRGMRLQFRIGNVVVNRIVQPGDSEWQSTLAIERMNYSRWRSDALAGLTAPDHYLRCLDYLTKKYGRPHTDFLGSEPDEGLEPHETTLPDDFNRADESPATGWAHESSGFAVVSNHTGLISGTQQSSTINGALSSDDMFVKADLTLGGTNARYSGVTGRVDAGQDNMYMADLNFLSAADDTWRLGKENASVRTNIADVNTANWTNGDTIELRVTGSTLKFYRNGAQVGADQADTDHVGSLKAGITLRVHQFDNFVAMDAPLAQAVGGLVQRQIEALLL